jgi:delta(3,5)-delta(2,4)-dienoyl-CoA isomerase
MAQQTPPALPAAAGYSNLEYFRVSSPAPFVAHVEIHRPAKLNAFVEAMWLELRRVFDTLSSDPDVRAVVLSGAGDRAFTAGLDVTAAAAGLLSPEDGAGLDGARRAAKLRRHIKEFQECISAVERCEKRMCFFCCCFSYYSTIATQSHRELKKIVWKYRS